MEHGHITSPPRINDGILQPIERPLLLWLASRLPPNVQPDMLTIIGIFGALTTCFAYASTHWSKSFLWFASLGLCFNWFGDSLDGTLARFRCAERPKYGFFVDQTADIVCQLLIGFGLGLSPFVRFDVGCIALVAYLVLAALTLVRRCALGIMKIC